MDKILLSCCCISLFYSSFSMNSDVTEPYVERKVLRSNVVNKINSIETNIDMMRHLNSDEVSVDSFIKSKHDEMLHLINALAESDDLAALAAKIDTSISIAEELRGAIDDSTLNSYIEGMQKKYENTLAMSRKALEDWLNFNGNLNVAVLYIFTNFYRTH